MIKILHNQYDENSIKFVESASGIDDIEVIQLPDALSYGTMSFPSVVILSPAYRKEQVVVPEKIIDPTTTEYAIVRNEDGTEMLIQSISVRPDMNVIRTYTETSERIVIPEVIFREINVLETTEIMEFPKSMDEVFTRIKELQDRAVQNPVKMEE